MALKPQFATIDNFSKEELKSLFDFIAVKILKSTSLKVKQDDLKLKGTPTELKDHNPTIQSILTLIAIHDLKFEFTIHFASEVSPDFSDLPADDKTPVKAEMEAQKEDIKDIAVEKKDSPPSFVGDKKIVEVEVNPSSGRPLNDNDLPDFG